MSFRFQRRVSLFPGVRLNFSRHGISTSIGPRGASITLGKRGATVNLGIPGTGLAFRQHLSPSQGRQTARHPAAPAPPPVPVTAGRAIASAPVSEVTSAGLDGLRGLIREALGERDRLRATIPRTRDALAVAEGDLRRARHWFLKLFLGSQVARLQAAVAAVAAELSDQEDRLAGAVIDVDFALDKPALAAFETLTAVFEELAAAQVIWDVTAEQHEDTRVTRSSAARSVDRKPVSFDVSEDSVLLSDTKVLRLRNANGADMLVYPGFIVMTNGTELALVELRDFNLSFHLVRFTETSEVPSDARVLDQTWAKCNKDGSADRRFSSNYQIPVVGYGRLVLKSPSGISEEYLVSSHERAERFAVAFSLYQRALREFSAREPAMGAELPSPSETEARAHQWRSLAFLEESDVASPAHAIELLREFSELLAVDINGFSGRQSMPAAVAFVNTLASIPGVVSSLVARAPELVRLAPELTSAASPMVSDAVKQVRRTLEGLDPASAARPEAQAAPRAVLDAERLLQG